MAGDASPPVLSLRPWERTAGSATHALLYALLFAMPIAGYVSTVAFGHAVSFFGVFDLPRFIEEDQALGKLADGLHRSLRWLVYLLVGMHAAAALRHHFVLGDEVLQRMLPWAAAWRRPRLASRQQTPITPAS